MKRITADTARENYIPGEKVTFEVIFSVPRSSSVIFTDSIPQFLDVSSVNVSDGSIGPAVSSGNSAGFAVSRAEPGKEYRVIIETVVNGSAGPGTESGGSTELVFDGKECEALGPELVIDEYFRIRYHASGTDGRLPEGDVPEDTAYYRAGDTAEVLPADGMSLDGYSFRGWIKGKNIFGRKYNAGDTVTVDGDIDLYSSYSESKALPRTGSAGIIITALASAAAAVSGLILYRRRKKNFFLYE